MLLFTHTSKDDESEVDSKRLTLENGSTVVRGPADQLKVGRCNMSKILSATLESGALF